LSAAALDAARLRGDPAGDRVVAALGPDAWIAVALMRGVSGNDQPLPAALAPEATRFFSTEGLPPSWMDRTRVLRAQRWAHEHLLHVTTALFCAALPSTYAAERGARVLAMTGRMEADLDRRVNETARFVLDVLAPGGLEPQGTAIRAVQKVRFVHAAVRRSLAERAPEPGETAINQEDLLYTLFAFSVIVVGAVRRLGVAVDAQQAEDFFHLWRAIGSMLGIEEGLMPRDFADANDLAALISARQFRPSPHGRALMAALLTRIEDHVPAIRSAPRAVVRHLVGERVADLLGVPADPGLATALLKLTRLPGLSVVPAQALLLRATPLIARPLLEAIVTAKLNAAATAGPAAR
jgi:hypothetical protein